MEKKQQEKEYVIFYKSVEHFEIVGFVNAQNMEEAKKNAQQELFLDAKKYNVKEAEIAEIEDLDKVSFNI